MSDDSRERAREWWRTAIIDIEPGVIRPRGYPIEQLIGRVGYAEMLWLMLRGELPDKDQAALLEAALVAAVDHGPQAPSIAIARMTVSSGNDLNGAVGAGIAALGDTHGGAGQQCMQLYEEIAARIAGGAPLEASVLEGVALWQERYGKHVPGFGHRFHPVDPRSPKLLALVDAAVAVGTVSGRYAAIGRAVEQALAQAKAGAKKPVPMNIDGATAVIFCELGFPPPLGRGLFLLSRGVGILSHAWEQMNEGTRIKGPTPPDFLYQYTGPAKRDVP
ncbi:MAG: citryl-CoA lyase [Ferrovibrio sp.]|nr:citryl-CoA lyase [Ferrovibrio sp.]